MNTKKISIVALLCCGILPACGTCNVAVIGPPEALLSGTWLLTGEDITTFIDKTLVFDEAGHLTQITTRVDNFGTEQKVVQPNLDVETTVSGDFVRIVIPGNIVLGFTGDLVFEANFAFGNLQADGHLQTETDLFGTIVITDQGPATLVKQ
jgi:hypothetical protein